jgi:DNA-binding NtrC family response regulator
LADFGDRDQDLVLVGSSRAMRELRSLVRTAAAIDARILVRGEPGTGKRAIAQWIHHHSARAGGPFGTVDCAGACDPEARGDIARAARRLGMTRAALRSRIRREG